MRGALRTLYRSPGFSIPVVLLLAFSIGANTLVFTAIHALLLKPLPIAEPSSVYRFGAQVAPTLISYDHPSFYADMLRARGKSFVSVSTSYVEEMSVAAEHGQPENAMVAVVSPNFFSALSVPLAVGRALQASEDNEAVVISSALAERYFSNAASALSRSIHVRGHSFHVVGVANARFIGLDLDSRTDVWVSSLALPRWLPLSADVRLYPSHILVRLKPGVSLIQAEAEVRALYPTIVDAESAIRTMPEDYFKQYRGRVASLQSMETGTSTLRKTFRTAVSALMGGVIALLLLVCANVGGLMVARAQARHRDLALRLSLGASRGTLILGALWEALLLSAAGTLGGFAVAMVGAPLLRGMIEQRRPLGLSLAPDPLVFAYAVGACVLTAALLSVLPAIQIFTSNASSVLGNSGGGRIAGGGNTARWLVMAQAALATLLAVSGVSLDRTLTALREQDPGFRHDHLIVLRVVPGASGFAPAERPVVLRNALERLKSIPGADAVSVSSAALLRGLGMKTNAAVAGERLTYANAMNISLNAVSENYFEVMRMPLIAGRALRESDRKVKPQPTVVTEAFAKQFFGSAQAAMGRVWGSGAVGAVAQPMKEVVGVARDARYRTMREIPPPTAFGLVDFDELSNGLAFQLSVPGGNPEHVMMQVRQELAQLGRGLAPTELATIEREVELSLWQERLLAALSSTFAAAALMLAGIGLFGMLAYSVSRRRREIGVRMAVGATAQSIGGLVGSNAAGAIVPGIAMGLLVYFLVSRTVLENLLFGVRLWDPANLVVAISSILVIAVAATIAPTWRAVRVDPAGALRAE